ncbi:hypothetical protein PQX77_014169 [Marasmius sp. AFHP31]|nr:hypothetical protein PQX77_014169 [Marasmius sp. AFHP31]
MQSDGNSRRPVPSLRHQQVAEGSGPGGTVPWEPVVHVGGGPSSPAISDDILDLARNVIYIPTVNNIVAPSHQEIEEPLRPDVGETIPIVRYGDNNPGPSLPPPSDFASGLPAYTGDPVSPATFLHFHLQEDTHRVLYLPTMCMGSDNTSVPAPFYQPLGLAMETLQMAHASGVAESMFGHPPFLQAPSSFNHIAANHNHNAPTSSMYNGPNDLMRSSSQILSPKVLGDSNDVRKLGDLFSSSQDVVDDPPKTSASSFHCDAVNLSSDNASSSRRLVGSPAITQASTARRRGGRRARLYFCEIILVCMPERDHSHAIDVEGPSFRVGTFSDTNVQIESDPATERLGSRTS